MVWVGMVKSAIRSGRVWPRMPTELWGIVWKWARLVTSAYRNGCNRSKRLECESGCDWPGKSVEVGGIGDLLSEMGRYLWKWLVKSVLTLSGNLTH